MTTLQQLLEEGVAAAVAQTLDLPADDVDPLVRPATDERFGHYQSNVAMSLAKRVGRKPREIAEAVAQELRGRPELEQVEVAGPGFINLTLSAAAISDSAATMLAEGGHGISPADPPQTVVIDLAGPNLAKEMHVGHLRSTIIGDSLARTLDALGHRVIRQNHVGDWGTQFGMLLEHLLDSGWAASDDQTIGDLNVLYQQAKQRDDADAEFAKRARQRVVQLQAGEPEARRVWQELIDESVRHMDLVFDRLNVKLTREDLKPESAYNAALEPTVEALREAGVARESDGALCVFTDKHEHPLVIRKSDGGFGYPATDLAAVQYRAQQLDADRLVYVVDARQRDHFEKVFDTAKRMGWIGEDLPAEHVAFGTILGPDRRPFKTREGTAVRLTDVLDEAVKRADAAIAQKNPDLPADARAGVAEAVGIGAVKYADLSNDRIKDYVFDYDRMLALEGNTAPYLQYSYTRIRGIFRKGGVSMDSVEPASLRVEAAEEVRLALLLLRTPEVIEAVGESLQPHRLCNHLYDTATAYHKFYERCPVLTAASDEQRQSRLALCALTAKTIDMGLGLLGIRVVQRM
jgi:arginyl-tRNA synthetase